MTDSTGLKLALKAYAQELGFHRCRIAPPVLPAEYAEQHQAWLSRDYHASMRYLGRDPHRRYDARTLLRGCRSVIVCAMPYSREPLTSRPADGGTPLRIAGYAVGADYHVVVHNKLSAIGSWLAGVMPDFRWRVTVDTSPLAEKAFALAAGIGWRGRHSLLLNRSMGSSFFLGTVLVTAEFEPDPPMEDGCGECRRCIDACPVNAFPRPSVLDARRCLSYITTARKAPVGPDDALNGWFFGCDSCQLACPVNQRASDRYDEALGTLPKLQSLSAEAVEAAAEADLHQIIRGTVLAERPNRLLKSAAQRLIQN